MLKHISFVARSVTEAERRWFWQWLAYPIQHPGTKLFSAVLIIGPQGSGKNLLGMLMQAIYGRNYRLIGPGELHGDFNSELLGGSSASRTRFSAPTGAARCSRSRPWLRARRCGSTRSS